MNKAADKLQTIDEAIEQFEERWRPNSVDLISSVAADAGLPDDSQLLVELIRIDIERNYGAGGEVDLHGYFSRFPNLQREASDVAAICYEDYRVRKVKRRGCPISRWEEFNGVESASWFVELRSQTLTAGGTGQFEFPSTASFLTSELNSPEHTSFPVAIPNAAERIGDFELVALLGEGAFSRVYLARQTSLGRRFVAAKVVDRPMQEHFNLSRLQHTGIVPLYSCHETEGRWVLCMPYSGATTLGLWLRETKIPLQRNGESLKTSIETAQARLTTHDSSLPPGLGNPATDVIQSLERWHQATSAPLLKLRQMNSSQLALWIFRRLASALAHAHQRGLVHGDIKPANILIRNDGEPALIDFNLSQSTESRKRAWIGGTIPYLSRTQLQQLLTHSAGPPRAEYDVHALGVIMFEIVEGRLPFRPAASTSCEELQAALDSHQQPPAFTAQNGSPGLRAIITACIAPNPTTHYPTAIELLADIDREIAHLPLKHARESLWKGRLPKTLRRYPRAFSGGFVTAAALMVIGFLGVWLAAARQAQHRLDADTAHQNLSATTVQLGGRLFYSSMEDTSGSAPSASQVLQAIRQAVNCQPDDSFAEQWAAIQPYLTADEQSDMHCCVTLLSVIAADARRRELCAAEHDPTIRKPQATASQVTQDQIQEILAVVPSKLQNAQVLSPLLEQSSKSSAAKNAVAPLSSLPGRTSIQPLDEFFSVISLANRGLHDDALKLLENAKPHTSLAPLQWMLRGQLQFRLGNFRESAAAFSVILNEQPGFEPALLCRGIASLNRRSFRDAEEDLSTLLRNNPALPDAWLYRCLVRQGLGNFDGAIEDISKAIELNPNSNRCFLIRARLYEKLERTAEAEADLAQARLFSSDFLEDRIARATALTAVDPEAALADLQTTERIFGPRPLILQNTAHVLSEHLHREAESLAALDRLLADLPNFQYALAGRAVLHARNGDTDKSIADINALLKTPPSLSGKLMFQVASAWSLCSAKQPELRPQAWQWLSRAIVAGYGSRLLDSDPDLAPLRKLPDFAVVRRTAWLLEGKKLAND